MTNTMRNTFSKVDNFHTLMETHIEYTKFNGLMPKLMAFLMPVVFKNQTQKWLDNFKAYAERN